MIKGDQFVQDTNAATLPQSNRLRHAPSNDPADIAGKRLGRTLGMPSQELHGVTGAEDVRTSGRSRRARQDRLRIDSSAGDPPNRRDLRDSLAGRHGAEAPPRGRRRTSTSTVLGQVRPSRRNASQPPIGSTQAQRFAIAGARVQ